jgi:hypothetical protein
MTKTNWNGEEEEVGTEEGSGMARAEGGRTESRSGETAGGSARTSETGTGALRDRTCQGKAVVYEEDDEALEPAGGGSRNSPQYRHFLASARIFSAQKGHRFVASCTTGGGAEG